MKIGLEYIKYRWKAKKRHGIHSPFVYALSDDAFRISVETKDRARLQSLFTALNSSSEHIEVQDFGAGSHSLGKKRKISAIFRTSSSQGKYGKLLYQLCRHFQPVEILEFGTSLGVGTLYMHYGAPQARITTIEACPNTRSIALANFSQYADGQIDSLSGTFHDFLDKGTDRSYDLIYVDGHHDGEALRSYMERLRTFTHDQSIFVLDDIRWSDSMFEAWEELRNSPEFHVSIDLFRCGILVRRPEQQKEHFILRP